MDKINVLTEIIDRVVDNPSLHAKWLNTLSCMENSGSRKISRGEHEKNLPTLVLKHAAEEARHAFYLRKQIEKLETKPINDYNDENLFVPIYSRRFIDKLDLKICRFLKNEITSNLEDLKFSAYLLTTYAIEVRADEIYPIYQNKLRARGSTVNVNSIILEEEGHLREMEEQMSDRFENWTEIADIVVALEDQVFTEWLQAISEEILNPVYN